MAEHDLINIDKNEMITYMFFVFSAHKHMKLELTIGIWKLRITKYTNQQTCKNTIDS